MVNKKRNSSIDSSSSPDSPLETPFHDDDKSSWSSAASSPDRINSKTLSFGNSIPSTTGAPPVQVMEPGSKSKYRIPSSVFARSKSNSPMEWSMASNDSLFSIRNMSFTNGHHSLRMAEVSDAASYSGQNDNGQLTEASIKGGTISVTHNSECEDSIADGNCSHHSERSNISTQSFAFPILGGGLHDSNSPVGIGKQQKQSKPEHPFSNQEPEHRTETGGTACASSWCSCFPRASV